MRVLITGGSGFLGTAVATRLLTDDPTCRITITDLAEHPRLAALRGRVDVVLADLTDPATCRRLVTPDVGLVYHFASLVSGGAERDFTAGMAANVHATMHLLEACRLAGSRPRCVFPSSIATFGGRHLPETIDDLSHQHPQNSYGVAKVISEQLLNDYSRKGFLDGRGVRLPAIVVRDEPNSAASGFASGLIREPLAKRPYICPVTPETRLPMLSLPACVELLVALGRIPGEALGDYRTINAPSLSPTAGEIAAAMQPYARDHGITFAPDPQVMAIVATWPRWMRSERAAAIGLTGDASITAIIDDYVRTLG